MKASEIFDVAVIGLGIMGSSAAYYLAKSGKRVLGLEQFQPLHDLGSSHGETRMIRKAYFEHPSYVPLLKRAYELWAALASENKSPIYKQTGIVYSLEKDSVVAKGIQQSAKNYKIPLKRLSLIDAREWQQHFYLPEEKENFFEPEAGFLYVENCLRAFQEGAKKAGAHLVFETSIDDWTVTPASVVEIQCGPQTFYARDLVIAAGAWAEDQLQELNLPLQVRRKSLHWFKTEKNYSVATTPCYFFEVDGRQFYGFPDIGSGEIKCAEHSGGQNVDLFTLNRQVTKEDVVPVSTFVKNHLPGINPSATHSKICLYTMTPDEHFILDRHKAYPNVVLACGFSGHGFKFASVIGERIGQMLSQQLGGKETGRDFDFLRANRF